MLLTDNSEITAEQISKEGLDALDDKYQKTGGLSAWDYFIAIGKVLIKLWERINYVAACLVDLKNMTYEDLVKFVYQTRAIRAKLATYANGYLTVTNGSGIVRAGDIFETPDGLQFQSIETITVNQNESFKLEC